MTIEEIERTLQTVTEQNVDLTARQRRLEETVQDVVALHQQVLRNHESRQQRLDDAFRQVAGAIDQLAQLASVTDGRLDSLEEGQIHADARLDALIDSQIALGQRFERMMERVDSHSERIAQIDERFDRMAERAEFHDQRLGRIDERLDRMAERAEFHDQRLGRIEALQAENAGQIEALIAAQARTDEQIRLLIDRNGSK